MTKITYIPGEIANAAIDEHGNRKPVTRTQHIFDDTKDKSQAEVNKEFSNAIGGLNTQNYITVDSFNALPDTGKVDTVYRVSNWDGTQQDPTVYSEYAWDGSQYVHLSTKTQIGEVFDISAYHATGGTLAKYARLTAALDGGNNIPQSLQKGGMSVKFIQSSDNKYVQYRLTTDTFNTTPANWQGVDSKPTVGSKNLVESGGVKASIDANNIIEGKTFYITDENRNIIAKIDKDGVHSVDFKYGAEGNSIVSALGNLAIQISDAVAKEENRAKVVEATKLDAVLSNKALYFTDANDYIIVKIDANGVHSVNIDEEPNKIKNDNIVVTDNNGYIICKIDAEGIHAPNLSEGGKVNSDNITIQDKNGYIIAKIDRDGIHSAKDKHAVACMVMSEAYYPTSAPTRDGDGNVTYTEVMFETGVAGSISITYANGNSSSVAVVYGDYNYTITINRDVDGNVETVSVN